MLPTAPYHRSPHGVLAREGGPHPAAGGTRQRAAGMRHVLKLVAEPLEALNRRINARMSDQVSSAICSARGCQAAATWAVVWNNPRLHTPDREKIWVACGEHKQPLADYLAARSFLKRVERLRGGLLARAHGYRVNLIVSRSVGALSEQ